MPTADTYEKFNRIRNLLIRPFFDRGSPVAGIRKIAKGFSQNFNRQAITMDGILKQRLLIFPLRL